MTSTVEFIPSKDNVYPEFLSRKPIYSKPSPAERVTVNVMFIEGDRIVNASMVAMETQENPVLRKVLNFTSLQPYYSKWLDLTHEDGILLQNSLVVIPESLRSLLLSDLHAEHLGIVKMEQPARKYLWLCAAYQEAAKSPTYSQHAS